jgi:triphosphoribosyl-dephospho-CoA synthase
MAMRANRPQDTRREVLTEAYLGACLAELQAFKPGNVSVHSEGHGMVARDFVKSAHASVAALTEPGAGLGERIYRAVEATQEAVDCNTNLGIVLLCAPLLQAAGLGGSGGLREDLKRVLHGTGVADASWAYRAIRLASPGGLGHSQHDVGDEPCVTLLEAMWAARRRDLIALQYSTGFADVFGFALPLYVHYLQRWGEEPWAAVGLYLELLARAPDTHVARRFGPQRAREISARASVLLGELVYCDSPRRCLQQVRAMDLELKGAGVNPGTTADLTVATLLLHRLEGWGLGCDREAIPALDSNGLSGSRPITKPHTRMWYPQFVKTT